MEDDKLLLEMMDFWPLHISTEPGNMENFFSREYQVMVTEAVEDSLYLRGYPDRKVHPFAKRILDCLFGQTLLNALLQDSRVSDIKILTHNQIRLKCMGCGHEVMTPRFKAEKNIRQVHKKNSST